jgi:hypothetical protein
LFQHQRNPCYTDRPQQEEQGAPSKLWTFSLKTKKNICSRVKPKTDGNNSVGPEKTFTFYQDLDPVEFKYAF